MQEVEAVCERVLILRDGKLALDRELQALHSSDSLILRTDSAVADLQLVLQRLPQVIGVTLSGDGNDCQEFTLQLREGCDSDTAAGNIAHCVQVSGARLYKLEPRVRALDEVFQEVMEDGGQ